MAARLKAMGSPKYQTDGDPKTSGPGFGFAMHPRSLDQPIRWTRPRRIFVNSMSDLFHGSMSIEFLAEVYAVMSIATQHQFQVLTKRPQIARSVLTGTVQPHPGARMPFKFLVDAARLARGYPVLPDSAREDGTYAWPLPNVLLGTSVEDQKRAEQRIGHLLATPAAYHFLSCEPLLGPVLLPRWGEHTWLPDDSMRPRGVVPTIDWVIVGGESGPGARPMEWEWATSLRDQCSYAGVPYLFKQTGSNFPGVTKKGGDPAEWPEPMPREYPDTIGAPA